MQNLTDSERRVLKYLTKYVDQNGYSPSVRDITSALGFASPSTVHLYLSRLEEKGYIEREHNKSRSLRLIKHAHGIPVLGRVHAGLPVGVEESADELLDAGELPYPAERLFALKVVGNSMIEAGILDGDTVVVLKDTEPENGDVVVAMVDGEVTVKTFYREDGYFRLQPENRDFEPIITRKLQALGTVVKLLRDYK